MYCQYEETQELTLGVLEQNQGNIQSKENASQLLTDWH
jgi:hypothetical protein